MTRTEAPLAEVSQLSSEIGDRRYLARTHLFLARVRDYDHLANIGSLTTPGSKHSEVTSERLSRLSYVNLIGMTPSGVLKQDGWRPALLREVITAGTQLSDATLHERQALVSPSDSAILMYTYGTTGFAKGALLTSSLSRTIP